GAGEPLPSTRRPERPHPLGARFRSGASQRGPRKQRAGGPARLPGTSGLYVEVALHFLRRAEPDDAQVRMRREPPRQLPPAAEVAPDRPGEHRLPAEEAAAPVLAIAGLRPAGAVEEGVELDVR